MLSLFARIWAKWKYRFELLHESARTDINARLAENRAAEVRTFVAQLRDKVDEIEKRIKEYAEKEEKGFWQCANGHEWNEMPNLRPVQDRPANLCVTKVNGKECGGEVKFIKRDQMTGQEKYESDKERKDAEQMAEQNRQLATEKEKTAEGGEQTAKTFRAQADNARVVAEKIRKL
jgi:hypothetical protein